MAHTPHRLCARALLVIVVTGGYASTAVKAQVKAAWWRPHVTGGIRPEAERGKNKIDIPVDDKRADIPDKLWVRIFRGRQVLLAAGGNHLTLPTGSKQDRVCWAYFTERKPYLIDFRRGHLKIPVDLSDRRWLKVAYPGPTDEYFLLVFETRDLGDTFRLDPPLVKSYFDAGVEVKVPVESVQPRKKKLTTALAFATGLAFAAELDHVTMEKIEHDQAEQLDRVKKSENCIRVLKANLPDEAIDLVPCRDHSTSSFCPAFELAESPVSIRSPYVARKP